MKNLAPAWRAALRDPRSYGYVLALLLLIGALLRPHWPVTYATYANIFIVDITRSMNTQDYQWEGHPVSRLEFVKSTLQSALPALPCGSAVGLGVFTERNSTMLVMPVEVCANLAALMETVAHIDWRMAWAADSNIGRGLYNSLTLMRDLREQRSIPRHTTLVFMTDGHEAPPINPSYEPDFSDIRKSSVDGIVPGAVRQAAESGQRANAVAEFEGEPGLIPGVLVGVGGRGLSPIPKLKPDGTQEGFYSESDVQQATRFGDPSPEEKARIQGYEARNAPWGSEAASGNEHYSSVREDHLQSLATSTGLHYHYLDDPNGLLPALERPMWASEREGTRPVAWWFALAALLVLALFHLCLLAAAPMHRPKPSAPSLSTHS
jgi:mxaL protein